MYQIPGSCFQNCCGYPCCSYYNCCHNYAGGCCEPVYDDWKWYSMLVMHDKYVNQNKQVNEVPSEESTVTEESIETEESLILVVEQAPKPKKEKNKINKSSSEPTNGDENDCYSTLRGSSKVGEEILAVVEKPRVSSLKSNRRSSSMRKFYNCAEKIQSDICPTICNNEFADFTLEDLRKMMKPKYSQSTDNNNNNEDPCRKTCSEMEKAEYYELMQKYSYPSSCMDNCLQPMPLQMDAKISYPSQTYCRARKSTLETDGIRKSSISWKPEI